MKIVDVCGGGERERLREAAAWAELAYEYYGG